MRNAFAKEVTALAKERSEIVFLSGDIGNRLFDGFKEIADERFFNCGVAEANMISVAAGLAASGLKPIVYTITPFITYRTIEQIRVDVCYHNKPVVIVGVGSGMGYTSLGATHHSCEDIAMMRSLPNMKVVCPGDPAEVTGAIRCALEESGPVYIRLGKKGEPAVHKKAPHFKIGEGIQLKSGKDLCILATGTILHDGDLLVNELQRRGVSAELVSMHTVKPLDERLLAEIFSRHKLVVTLEEHSRIGGFGSAILEWANDSGNETSKILRIGTPDEFYCKAGEREDAFESWGLSVDHLVKTVERALSK